jgi:hypothetical protein
MNKTMPFFAACLLWIAAATPAQAQTKVKNIEVNTPTGAVEATESRLAGAVPETIRIIKGKELRELRAKGALAKGFLSHYQAAGTPATLSSYDRAFKAWQSDAASPYSARQVVDMLGGVLGNACMDQLDMEWIEVKDAQGTDYAVRSKRYVVTAYPFSSVMKRVESKEPEFMVSVYAAIEKLLREGDYMERKRGAAGKGK